MLSYKEKFYQNSHPPFNIHFTPVAQFVLVFLTTLAGLNVDGTDYQKYQPSQWSLTAACICGAIYDAAHVCSSS